MLAYAVLGFGLIVLFVCYLVLKHHDKYWMGEAIVMTSIPIALTFIVFLLVSKSVPENAKELITVLSGIVGFIFGYVSNKKVGTGG